MPPLRAILALAALVSLGGGTAVAQEPAASTAPSGTPSAVPVAAPSATPAPTGIPVTPVATAPAMVNLVTSTGDPFDLASMAGHPTFVYFGYTHCPDVCPATMGELIQVLAAVPGARVVFATIDPERDTPAFLAQWIAYLPPQVTAVTGDAAAVRATADAWGVRYARVETGSAGGYAMSHTAWVYLVDPAGSLITRYPFGTPAQVMIDDLRRLPVS
ncbi:MAG: SCO family protein [Chloroflexota bacterium]